MSEIECQECATLWRKLERQRKWTAHLATSLSNAQNACNRLAAREREYTERIVPAVERRMYKAEEERDDLRRQLAEAQARVAVLEAVLWEIATTVEWQNPNYDAIPRASLKWIAEYARAASRRSDGELESAAMTMCDNCQQLQAQLLEAQPEVWGS